MRTPKISHSEFEFCEILWANEPISSPELVKLCSERLEWKKSTTYTVIRRLTDRGVVKSENTVVTSLISREEALQARSREVVNTSFAGSLPGFVATFTRGRGLTDDEIDELQRIIDEFKESGK